MDIDVVIIGVNCEQTLNGCIQSVKDSHYTKGKLHLFYVDGGSSDKSLEIAAAFSDVKVIRLNTHFPTPGLARNKGWREGKSPWVQFLDSDTILQLDWFEKAYPYFTAVEVVGIRGNRNERYPERSIFNWIADQEWNDKSVDSPAFGGDILFARTALEKAQGYNEELVSSEDPELSIRISKQGGKIIQLDIPMTKHDLGMTLIRQYWSRNYRTGYGFAALFSLQGKEIPILGREVFRVLIRGGGFLLLMILAIIFSWLFLIPAFVCLFYPRFFRLSRIAHDKQLSANDARIYAWHCSLAVLPQFFGVLRYYLSGLLGPLRNNPAQLKTRVTNETQF